MMLEILRVAMMVVAGGGVGGLFLRVERNCGSLIGRGMVVVEWVIISLY